MKWWYIQMFTVFARYATCVSSSISFNIKILTQMKLTDTVFTANIT